MDCKRVFREKGFYLAALLALGVLLAGSKVWELDFKKPLEAGAFLKIPASAFSSQVFLFAMPVIGVLPYGNAYLRERQHGFLRFLLVRRGRLSYVADKVLATTLGGMAVWAAAGLAAVLLSFLLLFPMEAVGGGSKEQAAKLLLLLLRAGLAAAMTANLGGAFAAFYQSYYMAYGLPFVCWYGLIIFQQRYQKGAYTWNPSEWILAEEFWGSGGLGIYLFLIAGLLLTMGLHGMALWKRVEK